MRRIPVFLSLLLAPLALAMLPAQAQTAEPVHAVTYLDVAIGSEAQGVDMLKSYRDTIRRAGGNLEFTLLQEMSRSNRFVIVEGWSDKTAFDAHDKGAAKTAFDAALKPRRNSPPDRHMLQAFATATPRAAEPGAIYMVEHVDFLGGSPAIATASAPLMKVLAESTQKEPGALRYEVYRQPPPRVNHYEVVSVWADAKAFEAHETAVHTIGFRAASAQGRIWRANFYDQRLYKAL